MKKKNEKKMKKKKVSSSTEIWTPVAGMKGQSSSTELRSELESKPKKNKVFKYSTTILESQFAQQFVSWF